MLAKCEPCRFVRFRRGQTDLRLSRRAWSPPATVTDPSKEDNTNSNLVVETNVAVRSDEEQKQPEGEVGEEGKEAGEPPRNDGVAQ